MAHYRKMVDELNAKAASSKKDEDVVAATKRRVLTIGRLDGL